MANLNAADTAQTIQSLTASIIAASEAGLDDVVATLKATLDEVQQNLVQGTKVATPTSNKDDDEDEGIDISFDRDEDEDEDEDEDFEAEEVIPEGFASADEWHQFQDEQRDFVPGGVVPSEMAGRKFNEDGTVTELGNLDDHLNAALKSVSTEYDEETGEEYEAEVVTEHPTMVLSYSFSNGDELTVEDVVAITRHRESAQLFELLSPKAKLSVKDGDTESEKLVFITYDEKDKAFAAGIERSIFGYHGEKLLPGIGIVEAHLLSADDRAERGI